jgi:hypothetical protein
MADTGAAFGFFPQMKPRRQGLPSDSVNLPVDVLRGRLAGLLGLPADIANLLSSPSPTEMFGDISYEAPAQFPYTTEKFLKDLPLAPTSRVGQLAGQAASFVPLNPMPAVRGVQKVGQVVGEELAATMMGQRPNTMMSKVVPQPLFAVAPEQGGFLGKSIPSEFVPNVEAGKEMIVHHNLSPEKLARVEKVGGMPVPSVAVSNVENPLISFGDISLIGDKSMAIPSSKNPVYGFDAYTARTPEIDYKFDTKSIKNIDNYFSDISKKIPDGEYTVDRLKQDWKYRGDSDIYKAKFLDEQGMLPDPDDFGKDTWKFRQEVSQRVRDLKPEFESWSANMDNTLADAGVTPTERIFKGYTESGNRRYVDATLDNLVKEMKGGAGAEGFFYGIGNIRAVATPKFKNFEQVKAARENIVSSKDFEPIKKKVNEAFENLTDRMRNLEGNNNYSYKPEDALYELGQVKNVNFLDKIYKDVPEALKADVQIFMNKVKSMPTEYFEIKPQRAVQVSEFEGAIVPKDVPQKSIDYLKSQGIDKIYFYETPEERTQLFKKFGDKMFAMPALPLGATGLLDEEKRKEITSLLDY